MTAAYLVARLVWIAVIALVISLACGYRPQNADRWLWRITTAVVAFGVLGFVIDWAATGRPPSPYDSGY